MTQGCFSYCWAVLTRHQGLFCSHQRVGWGWAKGWEGAQQGQLTPTDHRDTPCHRTSCSAMTAGGRWRKGGCSERWHLFSQVTITHDGALLSWRWLNTCLPMGSKEWIPCCALLAGMAFALPINLPLSQPMSFLTFTLPILSPHPTMGGVSKRLGAYGG